MRGRLELPSAPSVIAARNREVKNRLSSSSLVLGSDGPETRDWSLSSMQHAPKVSETWDPVQRAKTLTTKKALQASQVVLGDDKPGWQLSSVLPTPTDDFSRYRGRLKEETSKYIKTSSLKLGTSEPGSQYKTSMAREGFRTPDPNTSTEEFNGNRVFHDKLKQAERTTGFIHPDAYTRVQYTRSNAMPDFTTRLHEAKYSPKAGRELMLQIRMSNILFGDGRIKTFTTTQHDSMDKVVEETKKSKVPLTIRVKQDPRSSSIKLGEAENEDQWTTSSKTPNWFDPEIYAIESTP